MSRLFVFVCVEFSVQLFILILLHDSFLTFRVNIKIIYFYLCCLTLHWQVMFVSWWSLYNFLNKLSFLKWFNMSYHHFILSYYTKQKQTDFLFKPQSVVVFFQKMFSVSSSSCAFHFLVSSRTAPAKLVLLKCL